MLRQTQAREFCKLLCGWLEAGVGWGWDFVLASEIKRQPIEESSDFQVEMTTSSEQSLLFCLSFTPSGEERPENAGTTQRG